MSLSPFKTNIKPKSQLAKKSVVAVGFFALGRVLEYASSFDDAIIDEIKDWEDGYSFYMKTMPNGPSMAVKKEGNALKFLGVKELTDADMVIEVKNVDTAFKMISAQLGVHHVYAQHKIGVIGNVGDSMKLIRMIYVAEDYLFPPILSKNILKTVSDSSIQKIINRFRVLVFGLLLGKNK